MGSEQQAFAAACDRWDSLYYPPAEAVLPGKGASHWWYHTSATLPGKAHLSVNTPPIYVDIPASLQAVPPIENLVPLVDSDEARNLAAMTERLYSAWKAEIELELLGHRACVVKGLYGRTAAKVWWDADNDYPRFDIIDQPRNLWLGWGQSDYRSLDWACYSYLMTARGHLRRVRAGRRRSGTDGDGDRTRTSCPSAAFDSWTAARREMWRTGGNIEVLDYWYRQPKTTSSAEAASASGRSPTTRGTPSSSATGSPRT